MRARGDAILGTPLVRNDSEHLRGENRGRTPRRYNFNFFSNILLSEKGPIKARFKRLL